MIVKKPVDGDRIAVDVNDVFRAGSAVDVKTIAQKRRAEGKTVVVRRV